MNKAFVVIFLAIILVACTSTKKQPQPKIPTVQIKDQIITVDIADSDSERMQGLSGSDPLPAQHAMLFIFPDPVQGTFWMKDMKFPLDVIWIYQDQIVDIDKSVLPPDQTNGVPQVIYPNSTYTHVIEIIGGWSEQYKISVGDPVTFNL